MRQGIPMYKSSDESWWYYWLGGKQGYCNGSVSAKSKTSARRLIKEKHPGCVIDMILHENDYHKE